MRLLEGMNARRPAGTKGFVWRVAFTLVEMLVSLAVLVMALTVVTTVFNITTSTVSRAAALSELQAGVRELMLNLEQDLKYCDPTHSILVMVGRMQEAALTQDDLDARAHYRVLMGNPNDPRLSGYDPRFNPNLDPNGQYSNPRADLLMFFTQRSTASKAPPTTPANNAYLDGVKFSPIQVVYGHAAIDRAGAGAGTPPTYAFAGNETHIEDVNGDGLSKIPASRWHLSRRVAIIQAPPFAVEPPAPISPAEFGRVSRCFSSDPNFGADIVVMNLPRLLTFFGGFPADSPYRLQTSTAMQDVAGLLYGRGNLAGANRHLATLIEDPPANLRGNLGVHLLPGCAWFQVEFLMPEDPRNSPTHWDATQRADMPRWVEVPHGETYVFVPDTGQNRAAAAQNRLLDFAWVNPADPQNLSRPVENRRIRLWPYAIRITVRAFDLRGRLEDPVVRSFVHRFE